MKKKLNRKLKKRRQAKRSKVPVSVDQQRMETLERKVLKLEAEKNEKVSRGFSLKPQNLLSGVIYAVGIITVFQAASPESLKTSASSWFGYAYSITEHVSRFISKGLLNDVAEVSALEISLLIFSFIPLASFIQSQLKHRSEVLNEFNYGASELIMIHGVAFAVLGLPYVLTDEPLSIVIGVILILLMYGIFFLFYSSLRAKAPEARKKLAPRPWKRWDYAEAPWVHEQAKVVLTSLILIVILSGVASQFL